MKTHLDPFNSQQRGAVLVTALAILLVLALLGITALNSTAMEHKMARNTLLQNLAFQAAESGLVQDYNTNLDLRDTTPPPVHPYDFPTNGTSATVQTSRISDGAVMRGRTNDSTQIYGQGSFSASSFEQLATGKVGPSSTVNPEAQSVLRQGVRLITPTT